jgi:hypothetical protein
MRITSHIYIPKKKTHLKKYEPSEVRILHMFVFN